MEGTERKKAMELALHMKTPGEAGAQAIERDWPEIFDTFADQEVKSLAGSAGHAARIQELIGLVKDGAELDRGRALRRLHLLNTAQKLSKEQSASLEEAIWGRSNDGEWPSDTQLHPWVFLELPGKDRANALFLERIVGAVSKGQVSHDLLMNLRAGMERSEVLVSKEKIVDCVTSCLSWQPAEAHEQS
jgi:hypothetical protein